MYNYKAHNESPDGSHFFIKTPTDRIIRISLFKADEDYEVEFLEQNIRHLVIFNNTLDSPLPIEEGRLICDTLIHITNEFLAYNECVVKVEFDKTCGKNLGIERYSEIKPKDIRIITKELVEGGLIYFIYNIHKIESTDLINSLLKEYK